MGRILITGSNGQLGQCLYSEYLRQNYVAELSNIIDEKGRYGLKNTYMFLGHNELDITDEKSIKEALEGFKPDIVINCAAYTNSNKAEEPSEWKKVYSVNMDGVSNLAKCCDHCGVFLIHISTDYVFDGKKRTPYTEDDKPNPLNTYGKSKLLGEMAISDVMHQKNYLIFRTSWLYSEYGNNFLTKMIKKIDGNENTQVVCDTIGSPTYAMDLAKFLIEICENRLYEGKSGIYNFSNLGSTTWYDLAKRIEMYRNGRDTHLISPCLCDTYETKAEKPCYSVLSIEKTLRDFSEIIIPNWDESLRVCIEKILIDKK